MKDWKNDRNTHKAHYDNCEAVEIWWAWRREGDESESTLHGFSIISPLFGMPTFGQYSEMNFEREFILRTIANEISLGLPFKVCEFGFLRRYKVRGDEGGCYYVIRFIGEGRILDAHIHILHDSFVVV